MGGQLKLLGFLLVAIVGCGVGYGAALLIRGHSNVVAADEFKKSYLGRDYTCTIPARMVDVRAMIRIPTSDDSAWFLEWKRDKLGRPAAIYKMSRPGDIRSCFGPRVNLGVALDQNAARGRTEEVRWMTLFRTRGEFVGAVSIKGARRVEGFRVPVALLACSGVHDLVPIRSRAKDTGNELDVSGQIGNVCKGRAATISVRVETRDLYYLSAPHMIG